MALIILSTLLNLTLREGIITPMVDDGALLDLTSKTSRTGRFESVTAVVRIKSRDELESIYKLIAQSSRVVMTL